MCINSKSLEKRFCWFIWKFTDWWKLEDLVKTGKMEAPYCERVTRWLIEFFKIFISLGRRKWWICHGRTLVGDKKMLIPRTRDGEGSASLPANSSRQKRGMTWGKKKKRFPPSEGQLQSWGTEKLAQWLAACRFSKSSKDAVQISWGSNPISNLKDK